jgi:uncharacterized membrane protein YfcA
MGTDNRDALIELILWIVILSFIMEAIDSTLGGGFGTVLSPMLLMFGFEPVAVVSSILLSEIVTGFLVGMMHDRASSLNILRVKESKHTLVIFLVSGVAASVFAMFFVVSLDPLLVKLYISALVVAMGLLMLYNRNSERVFSIRIVGALGALCGFNKAISGGGYGPIATSGQIVGGADPKASVAITSISEAAICVIGFISYYILFGFPEPNLLISIVAGAVVATPVSAYAVSKSKRRNLTDLIAVSVLVIGIITLWRLFTA